MSPPRNETHYTVIVKIDGETVSVPVRFTANKGMIAYLDLPVYRVTPVVCPDIATLTHVLRSVGQHAIRPVPYDEEIY